MVKRKIIWTLKAKNQLFSILEYFAERNKSKTYSLKLHKKIKSEILVILKQPNIGKQTDILNIRGLIIENYIVFYELLDSNIIILNIWDCRQNPENLNF
jgi:plasmid stabilization system protein ParE